MKKSKYDKVKTRYPIIDVYRNIPIHRCLKYIRKSRLMRQVDFPDIAEQSLISMWENGKANISLNDATKYAAAMGYHFELVRDK